MIQFLLLSILLFSGVFHAKDPYFKIESANQYFIDREIIQLDFDQNNVDKNQINSSLFALASLQSPSFQKNYSNEECNKLLTLAILQAQMGPEKFQKFMNQKHFEKYGTSLEFLWGNKFSSGLYGNRNFQEVADWIIGNKDLTRKQADNVWNDYCSKRFIGQNQKDKNGLRIQQEYGQRDQKVFEKKKQKQESQRAQAKLDQEVVELEKKLKELREQEPERNIEFVRQQYDAVKNYAYEISDELWQMRDVALSNSELNRYEQYDQRYEIDLQTRCYLDYKNLDYKNLECCFGTALQQQYHQEICDIFASAARLESKMLHCSSLLIGACDFAGAAYETNKKEWVDVTGALSWIGACLARGASVTCDIANRYGVAVVEGVVESGQDFVHMVIHPAETMYGLGTVVFYALETAAIAQYALQYPNKQSIAELQQRTEEIGHGLKCLQQHVAGLDGPQRVKALTKFGADFIIPGKITQACAHLFGAVCVRARGLRTLEGVAAMLGDDLAIVEVVQASGEIEQGVVQQLLTEFMEAETQVAKANTVLRPLKVIIDEIKSLGGIIPFHKMDLQVEATAILHKIMQGVNNPVKNKVLHKMLFGKKINLNINHVVNFELKLIEKKALGGYVLEIRGGHFSGSCKALEEAGLIKIISKEVLSSGAVDYIFENNFTGLSCPKTEFPAHWNQEKIIESAWQVYESSSFPVKKTMDGKFSKTGIVDNVEVKIFFKEIETNSVKNPDICNILTMLPCGKKVL